VIRMGLSSSALLLALSLAEVEGASHASDRAALISAALDAVRERLLAEGLPPGRVALLSSRTIRYVDRAVSLKLLSPVLPRPRYESQADPRALERARLFMAEHSRSLRAAEEDSGVSASVIVSILWFETHFGAYRPRYPALDTLASLAALSHAPFARAEAERVRDLARERGYDGWDSLDWEVRARGIGESWLKELAAFIDLSARLDWPHRRVRALKSSWAAAIGYGQFLPTTALRLMRLGGSFEAADLWSWDDTVRLVGRHLREGGFRSDADPRTRRDSILHYNRQEAYASAVMGLAARLEDAESAPDRDP